MKEFFKTKIGCNLKSYYLNIFFCALSISSFGQNKFDSSKISQLDSINIKNQKLVTLINEYDLIVLTTYDIFTQTLLTLHSFTQGDSILFNLILTDSNGRNIDANKIADSLRLTSELVRMVQLLSSNGNCFIYDKEFKKVIREILILKSPSFDKYIAGDKVISSTVRSSVHD